jgi:hypothetical protein
MRIFQLAKNKIVKSDYRLLLIATDYCALSIIQSVTLD